MEPRSPAQDDVVPKGPVEGMTGSQGAWVPGVRRLRRDADRIKSPVVVGKNRAAEEV